jgi:hypothetical protein
VDRRVGLRPLIEAFAERAAGGAFFLVFDALTLDFRRAGELRRLPAFRADARGLGRARFFGEARFRPWLFRDDLPALRRVVFFAMVR